MSCSASLAGCMLIESLLNVFGRTDVERARTQAKNVDDACALRRGPLALAQGHSPRFGNQRIHAILYAPAAGHEQAVLGRRVEWLPDMDSNHD